MACIAAEPRDARLNHRLKRRTIVAQMRMFGIEREALEGTDAGVRNDEFKVTALG